MHQELHFSSAASLSGIWSALHRDIHLALSENEIHYLRMLALAVDDDLVSSLLLKKLKLAVSHEAQDMSPSVIMMSSFLEYEYGGGPATFGQLVHPSPHSPSYGISVTSLLGVGLLGLRSGQTILWPDHRGNLCDLQIGRVENFPKMTAWLNGWASEPHDA